MNPKHPKTTIVFLTESRFWNLMAGTGGPKLTSLAKHRMLVRCPKWPLRGYSLEVQPLQVLLALLASLGIIGKSTQENLEQNKKQQRYYLHVSLHSKT